MVDYVSLAARASAMIQRYGVPVTLTKPRTDDYDPVTSSADQRTPATFGGSAVRDPEGDYQQSRDDGTSRRTEFRKLLLSMPDAAPEPGDSLSMDGKSWSVDSVTPIAPGPTVVLYEALVRSP